ncbi:MAG: SDR family NAD(P)-dependent oxidoreductase [Bacteroidetes bacterium]|nr:SDR family NAD(P)-dependent oxidoreductase [Bacteroidota bacterium]
MNKIALITGATAGIGKATALKLAKNNYDVIITGRRKNLLNDLKNLIKERTKANVISLNFDIRNKDEVEKNIDSLPENWKKIDILINNAGLALGLNPIYSGDVDDWETMIDTNVKGLLYISRKIMPIMIAQGYGHIVNLCSIAGKEVYPNGNIYCATKHAVDAITKAMRIDLNDFGIKVTSISPGMVETEFSKVRFKGNNEKSDAAYQNFIPLQAEDIAESILFAVKCPKHMNIADMLILPTAQANSSIINKK